MSANILLIGTHGQLGEELSKILPDSTFRWGRNEFDLAHAHDAIGKIKSVQPDIIINTAAMTNVDACEIDRDSARAVNEIAPKIIADLARETGALFVHVSTDYVFGKEAKRSTPYTESDISGPVNYYGQTKLQGEYAVRSSGCDYLIVRTSGLYGGSREQSNFVLRVIKMAREQDELRATIDQFYSPTWVQEFARGLWKLIRLGERGIVHLVSIGVVSRYAFSKAIVDFAGIPIPVREAKRADFPTPALRPEYSALASERIDLAGYGMSTWDTALKKYIENVS